MKVKVATLAGLLLSGQALAGTAFRTPSGNILCVVGTGLGASTDITCNLNTRVGPSTLPRPSVCDGDWGYQLYMADTGAVVVKCGDAVQFQISGIPIDTAQYGQTGQYGRIECMSAPTGLTCRNADGHGFFLSRRQQSAF